MIRKKENFFETTDSAVIYFEDYGSGKPIVILHGFLCSSKFFMKNIDSLSENNRLILVDWRGHGSSSKTLSNLTMSRCALDIKELLDYLDLDDVTLIGWSMGSSIVLEYYKQFKTYRLCSVGVIDSALYPFSVEKWNSHSLRGFNMDGMNQVISKCIINHDEYCRSFAKIIFKNLPSKDDEDWVTTEMKKVPPWIAFALYNDFLHRDYTEILKQISLPLLICCADSTAIPNGIEMGKYYQNIVNYECDFYIFEEEGHVMFYENPGKFNQVILNFISK